MKTLILLLTLLAPCLLTAQTIERKVIASSGSNTIAVTGAQVSQTIGESMVKSYSPGTLIVSEGFQQSADSLVSVHDGFDATSFTIFPNPVGDQLNLRIEATQSLDLQASFVDVLGRQVPIPAQRIRVDGSQSATFDFSGVTTGTYLLMLRDNETGAIRSLQVRKVN